MYHVVGIDSLSIDATGCESNNRGRSGGELLHRLHGASLGSLLNDG